MAVVILGGLVSSAALNLFVLPGLTLHFGRFGLVTSEAAGVQSTTRPGPLPPFCASPDTGNPTQLGKVEELRLAPAPQGA